MLDLWAHFVKGQSILSSKGKNVYPPPPNHKEMIRSNIFVLFKEIPLPAKTSETSVFTRLLPHWIKIKIDLGMRNLLDSFQGLLLIFIRLAG